MDEKITELIQAARDFRFSEIAMHERESAKKEERRLEEEKDKRREDLSVTNRWLLSIVWGLTAIVAVTFGNLTNQIQAFNNELRDVRDRINVVETERRLEKAEGTAAKASVKLTP